MSNVIQLEDKKSPQQRLEDFAAAYAINGGDAVQAYIEAGFSEQTAKQNAKKYLDKHADYVMSVVRKQLGQDTASMRGLLMTCAYSETVPWNNRLKAIEMICKAGGLFKDTIVMEDKNAETLTPEQRDAEIKELLARMGSNG